VPRPRYPHPAPPLTFLESSQFTPYLVALPSSSRATLFLGTFFLRLPLPHQLRNSTSQPFATLTSEVDLASKPGLFRTIINSRRPHYSSPRSAITPPSHVSHNPRPIPLTRYATALTLSCDRDFRLQGGLNNRPRLREFLPQLLILFKRS
jgi:hypothetical protein